MIRLLVVAIVAYMTVIPVIQDTTYLPTLKSIVPVAPTSPTSTPAPSPYNVQAQDIVLHLGDLPSGFQLDSSEAMTLSNQARASGGVTAYKTQFSNDQAGTPGPTRVESAVIVFRNPAGAGQAFAAEIAYTEQAPDYVRVSVPTYGDASAAFAAVGDLNGQTVATYYLFFYKGNVWAGLLVKGPADTTDLEDAVPYVQKILGRLHE